LALTKDDIKRLAGLARLELTEFEKEEFTRELNGIFGFMEKLNKLDTTGVEPMGYAAPLCNVFRNDMIELSLGSNQALANGPDREGDFFKVPKILDD
jgi:aspartyl-tRNA(Asn)/glutamyl-tRNA(Gln) amidotransferase subunit C